MAKPKITNSLNVDYTFLRQKESFDNQKFSKNKLKEKQDTATASGLRTKLAPLPNVETTPNAKVVCASSKQKTADSTLKLATSNLTKTEKQKPNTMTQNTLTDEFGAIYSSDRKTLIGFDPSKFQTKEYHIAEGTVKIKENAFHSCQTLEKLWVPDSVISEMGCLCENAKNLRFARLSRNIKHPDIAMFNNCESLEEVILPECIEEIGENMFSNCISLKHLILPPSVKCFLNDTFAGSGIESITLPEGLETIGDNTFVNCRALQQIRIPEKVKEIGGWFIQGHAGFKGIECLSPHFRVEEECLISNSDNTLIASWTKAKEFHLPATVRNIRSICNDQIEKLYIDFPLDKIGHDALCCNPNLKEIIYNADVKEICESYNCNHIKTTKSNCYGK